MLSGIEAQAVPGVAIAVLASLAAIAGTVFSIVDSTKKPDEPEFAPPPEPEYAEADSAAATNADRDRQRRLLRLAKGSAGTRTGAGSGLLKAPPKPTAKGGTQPAAVLG